MTTRIRDEAQALGSLGLAALEMMTRVFTQELSRFPGLATREGVDDLVNGFFLDKGEGYVNAVVAAEDDEAAARLTRRWGRRWLVDRARALPLGALRNRLEKRLERSPIFAASSVPHYWYLADSEDTDRLVSDGELLQMASDTRVAVLRTPSGEGVRLGHPGELEELLRRLLIAAGRLHISHLTHICAQRFPSAMEPIDAFTAASNIDWDYIEETTAGRDSDASAVLRANDDLSAQEILRHLNDQERIAIRFVDDAGALAAELGVGRSTAYSLIKRLRARLVELAGDTGRSRDVLAALVGLVLDEAAGVPSMNLEDMEDSSAI